MKTLFIEAKWNGQIDLDKKTIKKLPKSIGLIAPLQFVDWLPKIKMRLIKNNKTVFLKRGGQKYKGQVIGCDLSAAEPRADAILHIGDGSFHPLGAAIKTGKDVFCFNPLTKRLSKIGKKEVEKYNQRKRSAYIKFLSSDRIGVLVSLKPGQSQLKQALKLKSRFKNKEFYYFVFDTIDKAQLENFPFIQAWINAACPRIFDDINCVNLRSL